MVIMDVDGVMTDGRITYDANGIEYKSFDVHDGFGISRAMEKGMLFAMVSGRTSNVVSHRAKRLGIAELYQGAQDKVAVFKKLKMKYRLRDDEICFLGDDEFDMPLLRIVGVSVAPGNAIQRVRNIVDFVTDAAGGRGAVREIVDMILSAKNLIR